MGMKNTKNIKKDIAKRTRPSDAELGTINANNGDAGAIISGLTAGNKTISYEAKNIPLADIRINPDNKLFNAGDTEEDIITLAQDIQRNGLMHNLVVFPQTENGKTVYVLLSGERRFRAMQYLERKGDATWNTVKNCSVITTELTDNEKKVLLYSANLQVRGGFANEAIRRQAVAEFIECLQKEPYNMSKADALAATKSISTANPRTIERDARVEAQLNDTLKDLLNNKFLLRSECETYLRFETNKQKIIADRFEKLSEVDCHGNDDEEAGKNYVEVLRDTLHTSFREYLFDVLKQEITSGYEAAFEKAIAYFDNAYADLTVKASEYTSAKYNGQSDAAEAIKYETHKAMAKERAEREKKVPEARTSVIQKDTASTIKKLNKAYGNKKFQQALKLVSKESRDADIAALNEVIDIASKLKAMIESVEE